MKKNKYIKPEIKTHNCVVKHTLMAGSLLMTADPDHSTNTYLGKKQSYDIEDDDYYNEQYCIQIHQ